MFDIDVDNKPRKRVHGRYKVRTGSGDRTAAMNISINFPTEIELEWRRRATSSGRENAGLVVEFVSERLAEDAPTSPDLSSHEEFMSKLKAIIAAHPVSNGEIQDSRESIYCNRVEHDGK